MNEQELQDLFAAAQQMQQQGIPAQEINKEIRRVTGGEIAGVASLELRLGATGMTGVTEEDQRLAAAAGDTETNPADAFMRNAMDVALFGGSDELGGLIAGAGTLLPGGAPPSQMGEVAQAERDRMRQALLAGQAQHPVASGLGVGGGGALVGRAGAGMGGVLGGAQTAGRGATVGRLAGRGMAAGGAGGAAYGGLSAEGGLSERAGPAAVGGGIGAAAGTGLGILGGVGGALVDRLAAGGQSRAHRLARGVLRHGAEQGDLDPEELVRRQRALGELGSMADTDPVLAAQAGAAVEVAPGLTRAGGPLDAMRARNDATSSRIFDAMRRLSDVSDEPVPSALDRQRSIRAVADRVYGPLQGMDEAVGGDELHQVIARSPELSRIMRRVQPDWQPPPDLSKAAAELGMSVDDLASRADIIGGTPPRPLTFREAQELVQMAREMQSELFRRPAAGARFAAAARELEAVMEKQLPQLAPANRAYAREIARMGAYDVGSKAGPAPARQMRDAFEALEGDPDAQEAFRRGLLDYWETRLGSTSGNRGAAGQLIRDREAPQLRERLRMLFDSDEAFDEFIQRLSDDATFAYTYNRIAGNSLTAIRQEARKAFIPNDPRGLTDRLTMPMRRMLSAIPDEQTRRAAAQRVGEILMTQGSDAADEFLEAMLRRRNLAALGQRISASPSGATAGVLGAAAARDATQVGGLLDF